LLIQKAVYEKTDPHITPTFDWIEVPEGYVTNYVNNKSIAQNVKLTVPICKMVIEHGNPKSMHLFGKWDYKNYILHKYCRAL